MSQSMLSDIFSFVAGEGELCWYKCTKACTCTLLCIEGPFLSNWSSDQRLLSWNTHFKAASRVLTVKKKQRLAATSFLSVWKGVQNSLYIKYVVEVFPVKNVNECIWLIDIWSSFTPISFVCPLTSISLCASTAMLDTLALNYIPAWLDIRPTAVLQMPLQSAGNKVVDPPRRGGIRPAACHQSQWLLLRVSEGHGSLRLAIGWHVMRRHVTNMWWTILGAAEVWGLALRCVRYSSWCVGKTVKSKMPGC